MYIEQSGLDLSPLESLLCVVHKTAKLDRYDQK